MIKYNPDLEWKVGHIALSVEQEGGMKICDIRGWGFLTGTGHACGLPAEEAKKIQVKHANMIAAAPELLKAAEQADCQCSVKERFSGHRTECWMPNLQAAIAKAKSSSCPE